MQVAPQKWNADDYAANSSAQTQWAQEIISKLDLRGNEVVLDVGCGDGKISAQIARVVKDGEVLGIDLSADMIRRASQTFPSSSNPNLEFLRMDAAGMALPQRFDIAFSNAALHWVQDHPAVLRGVRSCLKAGGKIMFQMGGRGNAPGVFRAIDAVIRTPRWRSYYAQFTQPHYFFGPAEYNAWLPETGFRLARVELIPKDMQHQSVEGLAGWFRTTWFPYTDRLPIELREAFIAEIIEAYIGEHPPDAAGCTHVEMVRLEVEAFAV